MIVKKYIGATAYEAMNQLKRELGSDAVVLNTRTVRQKGFLGFFKKPIVEITAACESRHSMFSKPHTDNGINKVNSELLTLKNMIENISSTIGESKSEIIPSLKSHHGELIKNGVDYFIATSILKKLNGQVDFDSKDDEDISNIIKYTISEYIGQAQPINIEKQGQKVIFFIGPTGVGKTTTLAKIAAKLVMEKQYKIGLITSDTYRVGAVDQLKTYSDILKLPLEVVYNNSDFNKTIAKFKEKDFILVDTVGQNHRETNQEDGLYKIMNSIKNKETYLVLSGTTNFNVLRSIIEHYDFIENYRIIFTKIDEAKELGNILNVKYLTENPISYITTGQNVPEDIEILNKDKVASWLIGEGSYERSS